jgi:large subunit ribosomal protein L23
MKEEKVKEKKGIRKLLGSKKAQKEAKEKVISLPSRDPYDVLRFVLMTEKSVRQIEIQNKLIFIVDRKCGKKEIRSAAENAFKSEIADIKTVIDQRGRKKAFVKFAKPGEAGEIAIRLGII